jgi:hypothetical protein
MFPHLSRRRFVLLSALGVVGAAGYGLVRAVQHVREAARRTSDL